MTAVIEGAVDADPNLVGVGVAPRVARDIETFTEHANFSGRACCCSTEIDSMDAMLDLDFCQPGGVLFARRSKQSMADLRDPGGMARLLLIRSLTDLPPSDCSLECLYNYQVALSLARPMVSVNTTDHLSRRWNLGLPTGR